MKNNLILSGLHFDLKDGHKSLVSEKMEKIFKHEEKIIRARVELEHDSKSSSHKDEFIAKGHLELKGTTITISTASDNINKSIDDLIEKLDRGLRRRSRLLRVKRKQSSLHDLRDAAWPFEFTLPHKNVRHLFVGRFFFGRKLTTTIEYS